MPRDSDILREASDINLHTKPTASKRRRPSVRTEYTFEPSLDSTEPLEMTATSISSGGIIGEDPMLSMENSHVERLLLANMGYFPGESDESNGSSIFNTTDYNRHSLRPEATVPMGTPQQLFPLDTQVTDLFAAWSDNSAPFTRSVLHHFDVVIKSS